MAGSPGRGNRAWAPSTRRMAERQAHALTTPAPASALRAFLRRSLAVLGRLAWLEVLRVRFLSPPRDVLLPPVPSRRWLRILVRPAHISVSPFASSPCSTIRICVVTASAFSADTLGPVGPVGGERKVVDGPKRNLGLRQKWRLPSGELASPQRTSAQSHPSRLPSEGALQNFVLNGGAAIMAIVYLTDSSAERGRAANATINDRYKMKFIEIPPQ